MFTPTPWSTRPRTAGARMVRAGRPPLVRWGSAALTAAAVVSGLTTTAGTAQAATFGTADRPFAASSPFNVRVPAAPRIDPKSAAMVASVTGGGQAYANLVEFGVPVYRSTASTRQYAVPCAMEGDWGRCPLSRQPVRIPDGVSPNGGSDAAMAVIDTTNGSIDEYWRAARSGSGSGTSWRASWGAVNSLTGSGWGGAATGSGASRLGGVVRTAEIKAGVIDHALALQSDNVCASVVRAPALKTDGDSTRADCLPEGTRVQLDPTIDLARIGGLNAGERTVARALQTYGGYLVDKGGAPLSISFERAADATATSPGAVYAAAGLSWDYYGLPHVPWSRLRVLQTWQG